MARPAAPGRTALATTVIMFILAVTPGAARAGLPGTDPHLTRAPYLTDVTSTSVRITWATDVQSQGVVKYGTPGDCAAHTLTAPTSGVPITVNGVAEFQDSVAITGLTTHSVHCYRVFTGAPAGVDLLGSTASPQFTTLRPASSGSEFSFVVFGDAGSTIGANGVNDGTPNTNQAAIDAAIAASGALFAVTTGDLAYQDGSQTNYGDLNQTGPDVSGIFGPSYWAAAGEQLPLFEVAGNHGFNATSLSIWPQPVVTAASAGSYAMLSYPSVDGTMATSAPSGYFAFTTAGVRFYVLEAAWFTTNIGTATGGTCGANCADYQVDHDVHWLNSSAEYQWLARDLATHPGGVKLAFFHFPVRSDNATESEDLYLQNIPGNPNSLEQLLYNGGVNLVFNGHAHTYQRFVAPPGGVTSYVTGGGGAKLESVSGCSTMNAYSVGWSYGIGGSHCGAAPIPVAVGQVFHFLKVTVQGTTVKVTPTNALGEVFDETTYRFVADHTAPTPPGSPIVSRPGPTIVMLGWSAASDSNGVSAYDVYRDGVWVGTTAPNVLTYVDTAVIAMVGHRYEIRSRDLAGNTAATVVVVPPVPALRCRDTPATVGTEGSMTLPVIRRNRTRLPPIHLVCFTTVYG